MITTTVRFYRVAQKSKLLTQYNSLLFLSHPVEILKKKNSVGVGDTANECGMDSRQN